jgi:hypothetical protein
LLFNVIKVSGKLTGKSGIPVKVSCDIFGFVNDIKSTRFVYL